MPITAPGTAYPNVVSWAASPQHRRPPPSRTACPMTSASAHAGQRTRSAATATELEKASREAGVQRRRAVAAGVSTAQPDQPRRPARRTPAASASRQTAVASSRAPAGQPLGLETAPVAALLGEPGPAAHQPLPGQHRDREQHHQRGQLRPRSRSRRSPSRPCRRRPRRSARRSTARSRSRSAPPSSPAPDRRPATAAPAAPAPGRTPGRDRRRASGPRRTSRGPARRTPPAPAGRRRGRASATSPRRSPPSVRTENCRRRPRGPTAATAAPARRRRRWRGRRSRGCRPASPAAARAARRSTSRSGKRVRGHQPGRARSRPPGCRRRRPAISSSVVTTMSPRLRGQAGSVAVGDVDQHGARPARPRAAAISSTDADQPRSAARRCAARPRPPARVRPGPASGAQRSGSSASIRRPTRSRPRRAGRPPSALSSPYASASIGIGLNSPKDATTSSGCDVGLTGNSWLPSMKSSWPVGGQPLEELLGVGLVVAGVHHAGAGEVRRGCRRPPGRPSRARRSGPGRSVELAGEVVVVDERDVAGAGVDRLDEQRRRCPSRRRRWRPSPRRSRASRRGRRGRSATATSDWV